MKKIIILIMVTGLVAGCNTMKRVGHEVRLLLDDGSYAAQLEAEKQREILEQECIRIGGGSPLTSITYDEFLSIIRPKLETSGTKIANPSKNNMVLNALIYKALESTETQITAFLSKYSALNSSMREGNCYINLELRKRAYEKLRQEIVQYSYDYEKEQFKKATGYTLASKPLAFIDSPEKGKLYSLEGSTVLQNVSEGMLLTGGRYKERVNFLYAANVLAEGSSISGYADYVGLFSYIATLGNKKTVNAYRAVPQQKYKKALDSCLFYSGVAPCEDDGYRHFSCIYSLKREPTAAEIKSILK